MERKRPVEVIINKERVILFIDDSLEKRIDTNFIEENPNELTRIAKDIQRACNNQGVMSGIKADIGEDVVRIVTDDGEEYVTWTVDEWENNPELQRKILTAVADANLNPEVIDRTLGGGGRPV